MASMPVAPPIIPVLAERGGTQLKTPRPVLLIDSREQHPFDFSRFEAWFSGIEKKALQLGDYSIAGIEDICAVERKDLSDLVHSFTAERSVFIHRLRRMAQIPHRLLVIDAALSQVKSRYNHAGIDSPATFDPIPASAPVEDILSRSGKAADTVQLSLF